MKKRRIIPAVISGLVLSTTAIASTVQAECFQRQQEVSKKRVHECAILGDKTAQTYLGRMYRLGLGVDSNPAKAAKWYRKAADQGDAEAQFNLGIMYLDGIGVTENSAEALRWIARAAKQKHATALEIYNYILNNDGPLEC